MCHNLPRTIFVFIAATLFFLLPGCSCAKHAQQTNPPPPAVEEPNEVIGFEFVEGPVIEIESKKQFLKIIDSGSICFVLLYSTECGPCRFMRRVMKLIAGKYPESVTVCEVDIDRVDYAVDRYDPKGYPTILIIKDGGEARRFLGTKPLDEYFKALDELIELYK
jgi:thioredoxin 1